MNKFTIEYKKYKKIYINIYKIDIYIYIYQ